MPHTRVRPADRAARTPTRRLLWILERPGTIPISAVLFRRVGGVGLLIYRGTTPHQRVTYPTAAAAHWAADALATQLESRGLVRVADYGRCPVPPTDATAARAGRPTL